MAIKTSFFNGPTYNADTVNERFSYMFTNGIITETIGVGTGLQVAKQTGLSLTVGLGLYHLQGAVFEIFDTPETISTAAAAPASPRIDLVVVEYNLTSEVNTARLAVVQGAPAASPAAPALVQTALVWQEPLASFVVPAGALEIGAVTDLRKAICHVRPRTYNYGSVLPATGNEGDIFLLVI